MAVLLQMALSTIVVSLLLISFIAAEEEDRSVNCRSLSRDNYTCGHCIQQHYKCAWCAQADWEGDLKFSRCDTSERLIENHCLEYEVKNPKSTEARAVEDEPLSDADSADEDSKVIQLRPQEIRISLRPKQKREFNVTFKQALDYPVDLYVLMDLSNSMSDDKEKLYDLGDELARQMEVITKSFRLGFGSFVDKPVMPWIDTRPEKIRTPCYNCEPAYGFKNHMPLTKNAQEFKKKIKEAKASGNLDAPEGGFDAVMQTLVCDKDIRWREKSRKIIVFSTDAGFHYAGDGRMAGIVVPNDGLCHMSPDQYYSMSTEQDYPSVGQLHAKIKETKANIIFAVTAEQVPLYKRLEQALPGLSIAVGQLANDSSNIVELVKEQYNKIAEKIVMQDNSSTAEGLKLTYFTACKGTKEVENDTCDNIKVRDTINFRIQLEATHCGVNREQVIAIGPAGLSDILILRVNIICDCDCESPSDNSFLPSSEKCNNKGDLSCGVCVCTPPHKGRKCECDKPGVSNEMLDRQCRKNKNDTKTPLCEGRGSCECGTCRCNTRENPTEEITGEFCECDNFNCPFRDRKICNGHGDCVCGHCQCHDGWSGDVCECPASQESCRAANGKICNDKGLCHCGVCACFRYQQKYRYSGTTCESCPTCPDKCDEFKPCVMCHQFKSGPYNETQCGQCKFVPIPVDELPQYKEMNSTSNVMCHFVDPKDDCTFSFAYDRDESADNITVWVKKEKKCPVPLPVLGIVLGVIAGIVLIGLLLLLIWKCLTIIHDKREYAKFEQERANSKWPLIENPLFHPATSTFQNPVYHGKKQS